VTKNSKAKASRRQEEMDRRERVAQMRKDAKAKERKRTMLVIGSAIGFCVILIGVVTGIAINNASNQAAAKRIPGLVKYDISKLGRQHTTKPVTYSVTPPVGGDHDPVWLNCGVYSKPVHTENAVHDMEHGAVWVTYGPGTPGSDTTKLLTAVKKYGNYQGQPWTDLTPFTGLKPGDMFASAWGYQLKLSEADLALPDSKDPLVKFLKRFVHGEQTLEPTASCSGGTGTPNA
jgi:hypothetical protein